MATFENGHYVSLHRFDCQYPNIMSTCFLLLLVKHGESHWQKKNCSRWSVRPGPNDDLFMRGTKLSELSSWKFDVLAPVKFVWMSLDHPTHSIRLLHTDRTSEDHLWEKRRSSHATNKTDKLKVCVIMHIQDLFDESQVQGLTQQTILS